jgi:hypothetical protein
MHQSILWQTKRVRSSAKVRLPNPNQEKPYERIITDISGNPLYGIRSEHTKDEEIVDLQTGQSNQTYHSPELVLNPMGCSHIFKIIDIGRREVECRCGLMTSFVVGVNFEEKEGKAVIILQQGTFPVIVA